MVIDTSHSDKLLIERIEQTEEEIARIERLQVRFYFPSFNLQRDVYNLMNGHSEVVND